MSFPVGCIANEFLKIAESNGDKLTPMKLQKLVYYAHGWYLALSGQPLISERIDAWQYGPVIPALYHAYKAYGNEEITASSKAFQMVRGKATFLSPSLDDYSDSEEVEKVKSLIARVYEVYGPYSATRLSNSTHLPGSPWAKTYKDGVKSLVIPDEVIKDYFEGLRRAGQ